MANAPHDSTPPVQHVHWGRLRYADALQRQHQHWQGVQDGTHQETFFTLEHDPVLTLGRRGKREDIHVTDAQLEALGVDVVNADRGGEVTYHGPGQLVIYPILAVRERGIYAGDLVRGVARAVCTCLAELGIDAHYDTENPGVWTHDAKIAAVGMRISRGVSLHGTAINLTTALSAFNLFVPCGMPDAQATSVEQVLGTAPPLREFAEQVVDEVARVFDLSIER